MKKFITFICCLVCIQVYAQHTPLKEIQVPDFPSNKISTDNRNNYAGTINIYSASTLLASFTIAHEYGLKYPDNDHILWELSIRLDKSQVEELKASAKMADGLGNLQIGKSALVLKIGERQYQNFRWYLSDDLLMIDIDKYIAEHLSISGFQGIGFNSEKGITFNDIEQELWRRCAKDVYDKRKHL